MKRPELLDAMLEEGFECVTISTGLCKSPLIMSLDSGEVGVVTGISWFDPETTPDIKEFLDFAEEIRPAISEEGKPEVAE